MKYIISGTNRAGSRTLQIANLIKNFYQDLGETVEVLDLCQIPLEFGSAHSFTGPNSLALQTELDKIKKAEALIIVCPEYNGSYPGALKYFIDHWTYPESFEHRPICFVGLGGRFGGLRPVEHLQQVFGYRNSYIFPMRVFLINIWETFKDGKLHDLVATGLLKEQAAKFQMFVRGLQSEKLDAASILRAKEKKT